MADIKITELQSDLFEELDDQDLMAVVGGQGKTLRVQAQDAIQKLQAQGKTALAGGIKALETNLVNLESQLEELNP